MKATYEAELQLAQANPAADPKEVAQLEEKVRAFDRSLNLAQRALAKIAGDSLPGGMAIGLGG